MSGRLDHITICNIFLSLLCNCFIQYWTSNPCSSSHSRLLRPRRRWRRRRWRARVLGSRQHVCVTRALPHAPGDQHAGGRELVLHAGGSSVAPRLGEAPSDLRHILPPFPFVISSRPHGYRGSWDAWAYIDTQGYGITRAHRDTGVLRHRGS